MERTAVQSRDLAIIGYDPEASSLEVTFRGGGVYLYRGVPRDVYRELMASASHGTYFNTRIKDRYAYEKIR